MEPNAASLIEPGLYTYIPKEFLYDKGPFGINISKLKENFNHHEIVDTSIEIDKRSDKHYLMFVITAQFGCKESVAKNPFVIKALNEKWGILAELAVTPTYICTFHG